MALRIGVHPNNLHLSLAAAWPEVFATVDPMMVPYAEGRSSALQLDRGAIDVCGTGSTPPILAQAEGAEIVYLAASAPRPANGALVVPPGSVITAVTDLRGQRVALLDGSFHTYLLARELERVGLRLGDVERVELSPAASLRALAEGEVQAWVAMDPLLGQSLAGGQARLLARCGDTIPNRSVFWTTRDRAVPPAVLADFVAALGELGHAIEADPWRAARTLADMRAEANAAAWHAVIAGRDWTVVPAGPQIIAEQQDEADTLFRHGCLPVAVDAGRARFDRSLAA